MKRTRTKRPWLAPFSATALLALAAGCTSSGFMVNGRKVTDKELESYATSWETDSLAVISKSRITVQQSILNLIAHQEATGATHAGPCSTLRLTDVVPIYTGGKKFYMGFTTGPVGPMRSPEDWRVEACGKKHSWVVFEDWYKPGAPSAVYAESTTGDWIKPGPPEKFVE